MTAVVAERVLVERAPRVRRVQGIWAEGAVWATAALLAIGDVVAPTAAGLMFSAILVPLLAVRPVIAVRVLVVGLVMAVDITDPAGATSGLEPNWLYTRTPLGLAAGPLLALVAAVRIASIPQRVPRPVLRSMAAVAALFALYLIPATYLPTEAPLTVALGPLLLILTGLFLGSQVPCVSALLAAVVVKAVQVSALALLGWGFTFGILTRPSFDSAWLLYPLALLLLLTSRRRLGIPLAAVVIGAAVLSLTRQVWLWIVLMWILGLLISGLARRSAGGRGPDRVLLRRSASVVAPIAVVLLALIPGELRFIYLDRLLSIPATLVSAGAAGERNLRIDEVRAVTTDVTNGPIAVLVGRGAGATFEFTDPAVRSSLKASDYSEAEIRNGRFEKTHIPLISHLLWGGLAGVALLLFATARTPYRLLRRCGKSGPLLTALALGSVPLIVGAWTVKLELALGLLVGTMAAGWELDDD